MNDGLVVDQPLVIQNYRKEIDSFDDRELICYRRITYKGGYGSGSLRSH